MTHICPNCGHVEEYSNHEHSDALLTRAINFVKNQKEIDIPEGWESFLGSLCAKFYEHEMKEGQP